MKKIFSLLLCIALLLSCACVMAACGGGEDDPPVDPPCTDHIDSDGDYLCDTCGAAVLPEGPSQVTVTLTVKDNDGDLLAGISAILTHSEDSTYNVTTATSDANGKITAKLYTGTYNVSYDYDTATIGYYLSDTTSITVADDTTALDLLLTDNNPNGTVDKPYVLSAGENELSIPGGTSYNYIIYRAVDLYFDAEASSGVKVVYKEVEYTPDANGKIYFALLGTDTNSAEQLVIENTTSADTTCTVAISSALGSYSNPIIIETVGTAITTDPLGDGDIVYYSYTATISGTFTVTIGSEDAYVSMLNTRNSQSVNSNNDADDGVLVLQVNEGDTIIIDCSSGATGENTASVIFTPEISEEDVAW